VICMAVCAVIESARVHNDMFSSLLTTTRSLDDEATDAPISQIEYREATKDIRVPEFRGGWWPDDWRGKFSCVRLTVSIPYIVSDSDLVRTYKNWRLRKKVRGYRQRSHGGSDSNI